MFLSPLLRGLNLSIHQYYVVRMNLMQRPGSDHLNADHLCNHSRITNRGNIGAVAEVQVFTVPLIHVVYLESWIFDNYMTG